MLRPCKDLRVAKVLRLVGAVTADRLGWYDAVPRAEASQFPVIYRGATGFVNRDLDADHRAVVAGLRFDAFGGAAGNFWICESDTNAGAGVGGRVCGRSLQPAPRSARDADDFDVAGIHSGGIDADSSHS